jgi:hypothetical protein
VGDILPIAGKLRAESKLMWAIEPINYWLTLLRLSN